MQEPVHERFQFTPLREGRPPCRKSNVFVRRFQFTPLREGRLGRCGGERNNFDFNSRPSARGDRIGMIMPSPYAVFQFTPLREGRQGSRQLDSPAIIISIHAPPRGATRRPRSIQSSRGISIHAPPRGATASTLPNSVASYFNSRPSARGDKVCILLIHIIFCISIHAPPRGATFLASSICHKFDFNSRPSARGDAIKNCHAPPAIKFQFTPLREGRPCWKEYGQRYSFISIHAPPRGATRFKPPSTVPEFISIHAPPRGATSPDSVSRDKRPYFNSRPSARGDKSARLSGTSEFISIHAPPRGATCY